MVRHIDTGSVSMNQIDCASRIAATRCYSQMLPMDERFLLAWEAIAETVSAAENRVRFTEMIEVGIDAIDHESRDWLRHNGRNNTRAFTMFWIDWVSVPNAFEEQLCQRVTLATILEVMPERLRRALVALAIADDLQGAAALLGQHYDTVARNVREAREFVFALWFEGEIPPVAQRDRRVKAYATRNDQFCKQGHELVPENTYRVGISGRCCRTCQIARAAARREEQKRRKRAETNASVAYFNRLHQDIA